MKPTAYRLPAAGRIAQLLPTRMNSLSPGQIRARAITADVLRAFSNQSDNEAAHHALLTQLAAETIIREDLYTGARIVSQTLARSTMNWLSKHSTARAAPPAARAVDFSRVYFGGSAVGYDGWLDTSLKVYQGGTKHLTMAHAMLTLASGDAVPTKKMEITHYGPSNVLWVTEGNHRLLARTMLGHAVFPTQCIDWQEAPPMEASLNRALLCLESVAGAEATGFPIDGNADHIRRLAAAYEATAGVGEETELSRFTREDLASQRMLMRPGSDWPVLDVLTDYERAYQAAAIPLRRKLWLERVLSLRSVLNPQQLPLTAHQQEIQERLLSWQNQRR